MASFALLCFLLWAAACQPSLSPVGGVSPPPTVLTPAAPIASPLPETWLDVLAPEGWAPFERAMILEAREDVAWAVETLRPTRYVIDARFDPVARRVTGREMVRYVNNESVPLDAVYFRLFPNLPGFGHAEISSLTVDGVLMSPEVELGGSALRVPMMPPLVPGQVVTFELSFTVDVPAEPGPNYAALSYIDDVLALAGFYPSIPVYDDEGWNVEAPPSYGDVVYADVSFYLVRFTLPAGWKIAASGSALAVEDNRDGTATWTLVTGPMRDFNLVASPLYEVSEARVGSTTVRSFYKPEDEAGGRRALDYAAWALRYFSETFGAYPFAELDVAATPTSAGGIEYPGLIVIADHLYGLRGGFFEWAVVHETAHQWWYGLVGSDQVDEPWLDEALAQYATLMYMEAKYGRIAAAAAREAAFERPYRQLIKEGRDQPVGQPVSAFSEADYGPIVYAKGPLFFHEMRRAMGDDAFRAFLRVYLSRYRYRIATPEGLLAVAQETCHCDLTPIYAKWILGATSADPDAIPPSLMDDLANMPSCLSETCSFSLDSPRLAQ